MQSRRRLKLAVVLLMAAGLTGGVAFWFSEPGLNAEERRLLGRWEMAIDPRFKIEFLPNRRADILGTAPGSQLEARWYLNEGCLVVYEESSWFADNDLWGSLRRFIGKSRFMRQHFGFPASGMNELQLRWEDLNTVVLTEILPKGSRGGFTAKMRRSPADK